MTEHYSERDRSRIRELAEKVVSIARDPAMTVIKKRWADVNALRKPDRAPVWCRPVGCWTEIIPDEALQCSDPELRRIEYGFLQTLFKKEVGDDQPVEDSFAVAAIFGCEPENTWGVDIGHYEASDSGGAWGYDPPLKTAEDLDKLRTPAFTYREKETLTRKSRIEDLLGDIMPVKVTAGPFLSATLGYYAADLRGLEQMMVDMIAEPEIMHRLMAHVRDACLSELDQLEATGLITPNNIGPMICSDPIGAAENGPTTAANLWCMANSQEFDQVSPAMWEEFCLDYQKPVFERFGLIAYGCCENLTRKADGVLTIPNLRIFTCSAWTDLATVMEKVGNDYCIMWRQKATDVVFPDDPEKIRKDLMEGVRQLEGRYYQIVLRELETLAGHPRRLHEWTRYAIEAAETYA